MKPDTELFDLIRSLTPSEKRYIQKYTSFHVLGGQNNYMKLFDAIEEQAAKGGEYDESKIKEKFRDEKFVNQLSVTKNYLSKSILKALNSFNYESSLNRHIKEELLSIDILSAKGLYTQSHKRVLRLKQLAYKYERLSSLIEILAVEDFISSIVVKPGELEAVRKRIKDEEDEAIRKYSNFIEFRSLSNNMINLTSREGVFNTPGILKKADAIMSDPLLKSVDNALTGPARMHFYYTKGAYFMAKMDNANAADQASALVDLLEQDEESSYEKSFNYIISLQNLLFLNIELRRLEDVKKDLEKLKSTIDRTKKLWSDMILSEFMARYYILMTGLINHPAFTDEIAKELYEAEMFFSKKEQLVSPENILILASQLGKCRFYLKQYEEALKWNNVVLNYPDTELRPDIQMGSKIMNLVIHFELGNADLLDHIIRSTYRYLLKTKQLFKFEKIVLDFLKTTTKIYNDKDLVEALKELRLLLKKNESHPEIKRSMEYFYIMNWIETKI